MDKEINIEGKEAKVKWVSTNWLEKNLSNPNLKILDTQPNIHDYISEHVPGAIYFNENLLRVPYEGKPGVYVPEEVIEQLFRRVGLKKHNPVVVYTGKGVFKGWGDGLEQTMLTYSLARFGHENIYILDGGLDKWKKEGKELTKEFPEIKESDFKINIQEDYFVNMDEVKDLKDRDDTILLDARPEKVYKGQGPWVLPGHIPGAVNLPWKKLMIENNPRQLKSDEEIQKTINDVGATKDKLIICSCGTGREATNEFLLFKWYLGYPRVKIYEGSFTEWTSYPENPTVVGEKPTLKEGEVVE
jgi:thiosulfate/3-mercaptopyruvate sulfurtransferase